MSILSTLNEINEANDTNILAALNRLTGKEADNIEEAVGNLGGGGISTVEVTIVFPKILADTSYIDVAILGKGGSGTIRFNQHIDAVNGPTPDYLANVPVGAMINPYEIVEDYEPESILAVLSNLTYSIAIVNPGQATTDVAIPAADSVAINLKATEQGEAH